MLRIESAGVLQLGLDMLKRFQCNIDLQANVLRIGSECVPFLGEGDVQEHERVGVCSPQQSAIHHVFCVPWKHWPSTFGSCSNSWSAVPQAGGHTDGRDHVDGEGGSAMDTDGGGGGGGSGADSGKLSELMGLGFSAEQVTAHPTRHCSRKGRICDEVFPPPI